MIYQQLLIICEVNEEEAMKYLKMAAENGDIDAMNDIAVMLENGEGCSINVEEAAKYFKRASDNGNSMAMNNYSTLSN